MLLKINFPAAAAAGATRNRGPALKRKKLRTRENRAKIAPSARIYIYIPPAVLGFLTHSLSPLAPGARHLAQFNKRRSIMTSASELPLDSRLKSEGYIEATLMLARAWYNGSDKASARVYGEKFVNKCSINFMQSFFESLICGKFIAIRLSLRLKQ